MAATAPAPGDRLMAQAAAKKAIQVESIHPADCLCAATIAAWPRTRSIYTCTECGGTSPKWLGKCPHCDAWNTLVESVAEPPARPRTASSRWPRRSRWPRCAEIEASRRRARTPTGIDELDRVLGGGIVEGGVVLIGGDPGIGKSTLLLQALDALSRTVKTLYVTGEESGAQVALRSRRLGLDGSQVRVLAEIQLEKILATLADRAAGDRA